MSDLVEQIQPGSYLGTQRDPAADNPSGSVARIEVTVLPNTAGVRFDYEVLHADRGRVHLESTILARTAHGLKLFSAHSHAPFVATLSEQESGYFVVDEGESPFPMAIRLGVPEPGRLVYSWSYGDVGAELVVRDVGDLTLLSSRG